LEITIDESKTEGIGVSLKLDGPAGKKAGMKIAILTSYFFHKTKEYDGEDKIIWGGAERYLYELCRYLQDEGHTVTVFQPLPMPHRDKVRYATIEKEYRGIKFTCLPTNDKWHYSSAQELNYVFNETATWFDLRIYFVTFMAFPEVRLPAISISHGIFWDFPHHLVRIDNEDQKKEFFRRNIYGFTAPDACVAVDTNVRNVIAAMQPGAESKIHVIPNFVDTSTFTPLEPEKKDWTRPRVLYPRRLSTVRGVNHFIKLTSQFPECDFLVCGNSTDPEMEAQLKKWGEDRGNIKAIWRPMENMEEVYQSADIAVIPTAAAEGTSLSCLEAMACGLPIIATPVGGLPNLVIDNWNGLVVDLNHDTLAPALAHLLNNPDLCKKFGGRNRKMAEECFDLQMWRAKWGRLIEKIMR
jgi:glycosyltransferase involved in cell wall biosynthesis